MTALTFLACVGGVNAQISFAPATNYSTGRPVPVGAVIPGDFNGDERLDVLLAADSVALLLTNAAGPLRGGGFVQGLGYGVTAIDLNGDGRLDLVYPCGTQVWIQTNASRGFFSHWQTFSAPLWPWDIIAADVNGDGYPDFVASNYTNTVSIWTNNGNGGFGSNATITVGYAPTFITAADINGDGSIDLITANAYGNTWGNTNIGTLTILTNNGSGVFGSNATLLTEGGAGWLAVADINGDGKPDLICANYFASSLTIYTNDGAGGFVLSTNLPVPPGNPYTVIAADLDGNGTMDLAVSCATTPGALIVLTNDGLGNFSVGAQIPVGPNPEPLAAADLNGDGKLDLICGNAPPFVLPGTNQPSMLTVVMNTSIFPPPVNTPGLSIKPALRGSVVSWPSASPGWSLQQSPSLAPGSWLPSGYAGYPINDDGTNKSLFVPTGGGDLFFQLMHP